MAYRVIKQHGVVLMTVPRYSGNIDEIELAKKLFEQVGFKVRHVNIDDTIRIPVVPEQREQIKNSYYKKFLRRVNGDWYLVYETAAYQSTDLLIAEIQ